MSAATALGQEDSTSADALRDDEASQYALDDPTIRDCLLLMDRVWSKEKLGQQSADENEWGRFLLRRQIGQGTYGIVFLAFDKLVKREVAIKIPQAHVLANASTLKRFLREAEATANFDHPGIVPVYEVGEVNGVTFIVSAYCQGPNLSEWLTELNQPVAPPIATAIVAQLAAALDYAHRRGVLHRDLKPSNILLDQAHGARENLIPFAPKITDFGLAKIDGDATTGTCDGALVGTFRYMSPEQTRGRANDVGVQADVWALGAILYELLAGKPAFVGDDVSVLKQIQEQEPPHLASLARSIPPDLANICHRCLQKELPHRYRSAEELLADLERFERGEPVTARPLGLIPRSIRWARRRPALAATAGALAVVSVLGLSGILWQWQRANVEATTARQEAERAELNLAQTQEALLDFAWIVQEVALYRRPEDPLPNEVWAKIDSYWRKSVDNDLSPTLQRPILAARHLFAALDSAVLGEHQAALVNFETGATLWQEIVDEAPQNRAYRRALGLAQYAYAKSLNEVGDTERAQQRLQAARRAFVHPSNPPEEQVESLLEYAEMVHTMGRSLILRRRIAEALDAYGESLATAQQALAIEPNSPRARFCVASCASAAGALKARSGDRKAALEDFATARDINDRLCEEFPQQEAYHIHGVNVAYALGQCQRGLGNGIRTEQAFQRGIEMGSESLSKFSDKPAWSCRLANICQAFARFKTAQGDIDAAQANFEQANQLWQTALQAKRLNERDTVEWGIASYELAQLHNRADRSEPAKKAATQSLALLDSVRDRRPEVRQARQAREGCELMLKKLQ